MELSLKTKEITSGTLLLNNIISAYSESEFINKNITNKSTLNFIHDRLAIVNKELDEVEQNLENFKKNNEITDISQQSVLYLSSIQEQDKDLTKVVLQLSVIDEAEKYLKEKGSKLGAAPSLLGIEDPILLQMFTNLNAAENEYAHKIQIAGEKDDAVLTLKKQISQLKQSIHESLYNLKFNLQTTQNQLLNDINSQNKFLHSIPTKERELVNISRQQALKNSLYNFLLEKREESELSSASTVVNSRLIEPTYSTGFPISPKPLNIYLLGIFFSFLIPFAYLFIKENLKTTIQLKSDIVKMTNFPIIGQILIDNEHKDFVIAENSRSNLAESFRATRTKLSYYINFEDKKVILVSSSVPGDGKTFFSLNIGRSYSLTGKKTILISADMRKPTLHKIFNLTIKKGLSNFLINMANIDEIIYNTGVENLSIIPVGPLPPNPSELLTSPKIKELLDTLRNLYDVIIIDTPPLGLISDSELIAPFANACVFLARQDHTPKDMFEKVVTELEERSAFHNISIIFNGIKIPISSYSNKYGYGYTYGLNEQVKIPFYIKLLNLLNINK
jgi:capsular exopolysaccharide synthesis family protein